jgi:hypothetical protein
LAENLLADHRKRCDDEGGLDARIRTPVASKDTDSLHSLQLQ